MGIVNFTSLLSFLPLSVFHSFLTVSIALIMEIHLDCYCPIFVCPNWGIHFILLLINI